LNRRFSRAAANCNISCDLKNLFSIGFPHLPTSVPVGIKVTFFKQNKVRAAFFFFATRYEEKETTTSRVVRKVLALFKFKLKIKWPNLVAARSKGVASIRYGQQASGKLNNTKCSLVKHIPHDHDTSKYGHMQLAALLSQ